MGFWHQLKQAIEPLRSEGLLNDQVTECLRGIEILETVGVPELDFEELVRDQPQSEDGREAVSRWLMELNRKIDLALRGGRVLVLKTMHLTHGLREFFLFDDTTTLEHVEEHLRKCYRDSIREYITKFTADLLPDGPIRLQFYAGSPRNGVEARPLDPETRVVTLTGVDTDGVYWWPQSKQPLRAERLTLGQQLRAARSTGLSIGYVAPSLLLDQDILIVNERRRILADEFVSLASLWSSEKEKKAEKRLLTDGIERAFRKLITNLLRHSNDERTSSMDEFLQCISFQIIGSIPNQKLAIRCGEEVTAVALPSSLAFQETGLMEMADAEIANVTGKGGRSTGGFPGHGRHKGNPYFRKGWRNDPHRPR